MSESLYFPLFVVVFAHTSHGYYLPNHRYKLEHNQISRSEVDKANIFDILNLHLLDPDQEIQHTALQLIQATLALIT